MLPRKIAATIGPMTTESTFRAIAVANIAVCLPIGLYFRIKSRARGERLARREEGIVVMIGLRLCGVLGWALLAAYLVNPAWTSWSSIVLPDWPAGPVRRLPSSWCPSSCSGRFESLGKNLTDTVVTRRDHTLVTQAPTAGSVTRSMSSWPCGGSR